MLSALAGRARVPAVLAVCDDEAVIGAPFYVMERVEGDVVTSAVPAELDSAEDRRRIGEELVDALVEIHAVDWRDAGLEGFGKPTGYLERQLRRFLGLWEHNRTREIPAVESRRRVAQRRTCPSPARGDRRPRRLPPGQHDAGARRRRRRLVAIFDWEMATIGDPLADVGYLCTLWVDADDPPGGMFELSARDARGGLPAARGARRPLRGALAGAR